jgi:hypothetical protein
MSGNVTALEGWHVTYKYKKGHGAHMLQVCGLGSSHCPRHSHSPDSHRYARIPSAKSTLRRLHQRTSADVCPSTIPPVIHEELRHALCLTLGKQTQRRGTLPRHTLQRVRNKRHENAHILRPGVLEILDLRPLARFLH